MSTSQQPVIFSTDDYVMPSWAARPQHKFFFEIIKQGSIIGNLLIKHKQFSLVGRLEDLCDIFIDNPTVSRKHAILQFQSSDPLPLLYDLGSAQGTFVNKQRLPPKAYKKLQLFANIKFGTSSRYYILRCPELQQKLNEEDEQKQNEFIKTLTLQNRMLTKQQAKSKYMELLNNDPYFGGQLKSRKFQGHQAQQKETYKQYEGISWGIGDQDQVYAYRNQKEFPIEPDVLRRLPGLDETTLQKIAQYEDKFRIYDQIEAELNELANRQKKQFGLEEKLQNKKQKLQKRFVQSLQALEQCQDWIRVNMFGQQNTTQNNKNKKKQKEADTFSDDQFYDRTLEDKHVNKEEKNEKKKTRQVEIKESTVEDLWLLKNTFLAQLARKKEIINLKESAKLNTNTNEPIEEEQMKNQDQVIQQNQAEAIQQQQDELQLFMKENEQNLQQQNKGIYQRQLESVQSKLKELKQKLLRFLSAKQIKRLQEEILNPQRIKQKQEKKQQKQVQQKQHLQKTLHKLQAQQKARQQKIIKRQQLQKQCQNEYSEKIFDLYRGQYQQQQNQQDQQFQSKQYGDQQFKLIPNGPNRVNGLSRANVLNRANRADRYNQDEQQQYYQYSIPHKRIHQNQNQQRFQQQQNHSDQEDKVFDLTKNV